MFIYVVKPVIEFMHLIHKCSGFLLRSLISVGRWIFLICLKVCYVLSETFSALVIIGEELYNFICELNSSAAVASHYIRTSANCGINSVIEACLLFFHHLCQFLLNTKLHSKLLATKTGVFVCDVSKVVQGALLLIADLAWWLVTLIPRTACYIVIYVGDVLVTCITAVRKALVYAISVVVEDIFRLTIGLVLLILLWRNKRRIALFLLGCLLIFKRIFFVCYHRLLLSINRLMRRRRRGPPSELRIIPTRSRLSRHSVSPASDKSIEAHQRCVVCREFQKCVVLMPCKHLCLCEECADHIIAGERQNCPLCRAQIAHSISVYT